MTSVGRPRLWRRSPLPWPATSGSAEYHAASDWAARSVRSCRGCSRLVRDRSPARSSPGGTPARDDARRDRAVNVAATSDAEIAAAGCILGANSSPATLSRPCGCRRCWRRQRGRTVPDDLAQDAAAALAGRRLGRPGVGGPTPLPSATHDARPASSCGRRSCELPHLGGNRANPASGRESCQTSRRIPAQIAGSSPAACRISDRRRLQRRRR